MLTIENNVLVKCDENATEVVIPEGVTEINWGAFEDCKLLTSIVIPESIKKIRGSAFSGCESLKSIVIPKGVTEIGFSAFGDCQSLSSIVIPEGVNEIGYNAFAGCVSLKSIVIPKSLKDINSSDLKDCTALSNIKYDGTIAEWNILYSELFHDGSSEITIECSDGIAVPYSKQENFVSIVIPDSVNKISDFAFENCSSLTSVTIPESVTEIGEYAFAGCKSLKSIVIPDSVTKIGEAVFKDCEKLSSVTLSKRIDNIPSEAFYNCTSLTTIEMPEHVRFIEEFALCNTSKLKTITIHNRLRFIFNNAFKDSGIENIYYKGSKSAWEWIKIDQPWGIPCKYTDFNVTIHCSDGDIPFVEILSSSANGVLYGMGSKLIKCDENATDVLIPADIHEFARSAFEGCKSLKTLRFTKDFDFVSLYDEFDPSNGWDDSFDIFVFDSLTDVYYEGTTVEWIDAAGFLFFPKHVKIHCSDGEASPLTPDMEKIVIPAGVTELPNYAFYSYNCKEIELPAGLKYIGDKAFEESEIGTINFKGTKEQWEKISKDQPWGTYRELREWMVAIVHCSDGDVPFFDKDVVIDDNGVVVEPADFFIFDYTIPADVKKIGRYAFDVDNYDDPRGESDSDFELTYEGTKEQWLKIEKGENWDGNKVAVVHCSDGDIQINKGNKDLNEKLINAVREGNLEEVKKLIIEGASVNAANDSWGTALDIALRRDFKEIAEFLIKQGSDVTRISKSTFALVVDRGSKELVELLLAHGVNVNVVLRYGRTALMIAACKSNKEMIEFLIEHGADVNAVDEYGRSALTYAVNGGSKELVELLIAHGADINTDCNFTSAVKNKEMLAILLNNKLDVDKIAESAEALSAAVDCSNKEAVELLINHGANVKTTALLNCHTIEIAKLLIDHGADVNVADEHGKTALMVTVRRAAVDSDSKELVELLIAHGANINAADESGYTALMVAAKHNEKEITKFLVERGADVNAKTKRGLTALILASDNRHKLDLVEFLLTHGADVNAAMDDGRTSLMIAASRSNKEMLELLIEHDADINARTKLGETPLMWCSYSERNAVTLIEHGADVNAVNKQGTSTYEMFIDSYGKDSGIVEFLVQHGAKTNVHNLFIEAIKNNNTDEVLKFINNGANLNLSFHIPSRYTPLMVAAQYDSKEVAELLIEHGAKVNHEPIELDGGAYYFPLSAAAEWNAKNVAEVLINHGAWLDALDRDDYDIDEFLRPIDFAMINNSKDVVEVFLNHGYEFNRVNFYKEVEDVFHQDFEDPISYAEEHNFTELAELLKKHFKKS